MKGRYGSTSFLPLKKKGGFQGKIQSELCLTKEQAKQVYDKIESGEEVKIRKTMQQNTSISPKQVPARKDVNQYKKALMSDRDMIKSNSQMEQWSILSDTIVYVKLEDNDIMNGIHIKLIDYRDHKRMYRKMGKEEGEQLNIDFGEKKLILIETLFVEEISGMAIIKIIDQGQKTLMMLKLKYLRNKATLDITNNTRETVIFDKTSIGILDLRSLGY